MEHAIVFYDGTCGVCDRFVRFVIRHDRNGCFLFAPLGGSTFLRMRRPSWTSSGETIVLLTVEGGTLVKTRAVIGVLDGLSWPYRGLGKMLRCVPAALADAAYDSFARRRHGWPSRRTQACPTVGTHERARFLD